MSHFSLDFPYAYGAPEARARFRVEPDDFQVDERAGFTPTGEGEHQVLLVRKQGENTAWVAQQLARLAGVSEKDVGYCGRKDRHATTSQWFSVYLSAREPAARLGEARPAPDWGRLESPSVRVLAQDRHSKKLRRGEHQGNHFVIRLRNVETKDVDAFQARLESLLHQGVPNYYGEQRFGRAAANLTRAEALVAQRRSIRNRQERSMALSAARSWIFNQVLAERVRLDNWRERLSGDPEPVPSGPLWGRGRSRAQEQTRVLESRVLEPWSHWCDGLEHLGLQQERRVLALLPEEPEWRWCGPDLQISFSLPPGTFATAILREIAHLDSAAENA